MKRLCAILVCLGIWSPLAAQEGPGTIESVEGINYNRPELKTFTGLIGIMDQVLDGSGGIAIGFNGNLYASSGYKVWVRSPDGNTRYALGKSLQEYLLYGTLFPLPIYPSRYQEVLKRSTDDRITASEALIYSTISGQAGIALSCGMAVDLKGNLYVASGGAHRIRQVAPNGYVWTLAGSVDSVSGVGGFGGDGGPSRQARLSQPSDVTLDAQGNFYIADYGNNRIRLVNREGYIQTFAGNGAKPVSEGQIGDGGPATLAVLHTPVSVAADPQGNVYVAELYGHRVRKIAPDGQHTITSYAGTGEAGYSGDGGPATRARLNSPMGVAVDMEGGVYIADWCNHRIRKVDPNGTISTFAGTGVQWGSWGDGGPATQARMDYPRDVAVDGKGYVYVASWGPNANPASISGDAEGRIRRVSPAKVLESPSAQLSVPSIQFGAPGNNTSLEKAFTLSNPAKETPLQVELMVEESPPEFILVPANFVVPAGGSQAVQVRFTPSTLRPASVTMLVYHSGREENPLKVSLNYSGAIKSADFDGNGRVDLDDFFLFAGAFGRDGAGEYTRYDLDGDWKIGFDDFFLFAGQFGK